MSDGLASFCDDFYIDMYVNTELDLPTERDTITTFFERVQKQYPKMVNLYRRGEREYCLEEDQTTGQYRWITIETDRIASGMINPAEFEHAYAQHRLILELIPYMLSVSPLEISSLDVTFAMDFDYTGNHDEVIAEAVYNSTAFGSLLDLPQARAIGYSPAVVVALSDDYTTQARVAIESKTSIFDPRKQKETSDEAISLALAVRQYPTGKEKFDLLASFGEQCRLAEELMAEKIVPNLVRPLNNVIAHKRIS